MSLSDDLRAKLEPAISDLQCLSQRLDDLISLEESLGRANEGLARASDGVHALAAQARAAQESLSAALNSFEQVASAVAALEPTLRQIAEGQAKNAQAFQESIAQIADGQARHAAFSKRIGLLTLFGMALVVAITVLTFANT